MSGNKWGDPGTYLVVWHCGDDVCDCYQPKLETRGRREINGVSYDSFLLNEIEVGPFHSEPGESEWIAMKKAFDEAKEKYKPDFVQDFYWPLCARLADSEGRE